MTTKLFAIIIVLVCVVGFGSVASAQEGTVITKETLQIEAKAAADVAKLKAESTKRIAKLEAKAAELKAERELAKLEADIKASKKSPRTIEVDSLKTKTLVKGDETSTETVSEVSSKTHEAGELELNLRKEQRKENVGVAKAKNPGCGWLGCGPVYTNGYGGGYVQSYSQPNVGEGGYVQAYRQP